MINLINTIMIVKLKKSYLFIALILLWPAKVLAQGITGMLNEAAGPQGAGYDTTATGANLSEVAGLITRMFLSLLGVVFIAYTIYGGYLWLASAGHEEKVTKAKQTLRNGIIGVIVILSAAAIYYFIASALLGGGVPGGSAL